MWCMFRAGSFFVSGLDAVGTLQMYVIISTVRH